METNLTQIIRGICINSNLGKILCSIINSRLHHFLDEHNVLSRSQIGFLKNDCTTDHIYTLHTLIDQQVNQNKGKIDLFDSIWHKGIFYKLIESGIGGETYDFIKSMYTKNKYAVKIALLTDLCAFSGPLRLSQCRCIYTET